jgi:hypothetical protein
MAVPGTNDVMPTARSAGRGLGVGTAQLENANPSSSTAITLITSRKFLPFVPIYVLAQQAIPMLVARRVFVNTIEWMTAPVAFFSCVDFRRTIRGMPVVKTAIHGDAPFCFANQFLCNMSPW